MAAEVGNENDDTLKAAISLAPRIRAAAPEIEKNRRLPDHIVEAIRATGAFRMPMPRNWGGPEIDPLTQIRILEELARGDGSAGWCAMINSDGGYFSAFLEQDVAREMYPDLDMPTGSSLVFTGQAEKVKGGYRISGRWPFVSGCHHCEWIVGTCTVIENGSPRVTSRGNPERRMCFMRRRDGEILDTWHTTGLCGSGSNDFAVKELFVPEEHSFGFPMTPKREGPLYAYPLMFAYNMPGVVLGIARSALDTFTELAEQKQVTTSMLTGRKVMLRDEAYAQSAAAHAESVVGSARSYIFERMASMWETLTAGNTPSVRQRALFRAALIHAHSACVQAVELLYKAYGGSAVYASGPFDRHLRDVLTINQHTVNSPKVLETAGRVLLGLDLHDPLF